MPKSKRNFQIGSSLKSAAAVPPRFYLLIPSALNIYLARFLSGRKEDQVRKESFGQNWSFTEVERRWVQGSHSTLLAYFGRPGNINAIKGTESLISHTDFYVLKVTNPCNSCKCRVTPETKMRGHERLMRRWLSCREETP